VVFGVILSTGVVYGVTARPVARRLDVARPAPRGVGLFGDDAWLVTFGRELTRAGVPTLLIRGEARPRPGASDDTDEPEVVTVSLHGGEERVDEAIESMGLSTIIASFRPGTVHSLFVARLTEHVGRRHVLLLPDEIPSIGGFTDPWIPRPFGTLTRSELERRLASGWTISSESGSGSDDEISLARIRSDGTVHFRPDDRERVDAETSIVLRPPRP
jgi:hypothetical protein